VNGVIIAGEDRYTPARDRPDHTAAEAVVWRHWRHHPGTVPAPLVGQLRGEWPTGAHPTVTSAARVDHGRWLVDCPWPGCNSSQYASRLDHRFFCVDGPHDGHFAWIPVVWPTDVEMATIEAVLDARPEPATRNWAPGEPINQLVAENAGHDLPPAAP
jgi:hypothetical protein